MVNNNELLYVVDDYDTPLVPVSRSEAFAKGLLRRTAHVWIINEKREVLCQQRSLKKDKGAGLWEPAVAGHLGPDDNYFTGAVREVREETGLEISPSDLNLVKIYKDETFREYRGIFYCKLSELEIHHVKREEDEVEKVKLIKLNTLKKYLIHQKHKSWIKPPYAKEMFSVLN